MYVEFFSSPAEVTNYHGHDEAYVSPFRDAVLEQKPTLLQTLLANAIASAQAFDQVCGIFEVMIRY